MQKQANQWRLIPRVSYVNFRKKYPQAGEQCWAKWFSIDRYWSGRIINVHFKHHAIVLDFRRDWIADMAA